MKPFRSSLAELLRSYAEEKAQEEWRGEWVEALLYRPVAILVAPLVLAIGIGATAITLTALLLALVLPFLAWYGGDGAGYVWVAVAAMAIGIFDCLDGTIARATRNISRLGAYLDFLTDVVARITLYMAIGIFAQRMPDIWLVPPLALTLFAALLAIVARLCRFYAAARHAGEIAHAPGAPQSTLVSFVSGLDRLTPFLLLVAGMWNSWPWLIYWLFFYSALDFAHTQYAVLKQSR